MTLNKFSKQKINQLREFYKEHEGYLIPGALASGFVFDIFAFRAIGIGNLIYVFLAHLVFIGINISAINYFRERPPTGRIGSYWQFLAPLLVQFSFGNLFNGFLIFYFQSGSFFASWPFFLVLIILIVGNEIARRYDVTPLLRISVYFFTIFAYLNLVFPYIFKSLGLTIFLVSGFLSLLVIIGFIYLVSRFSEEIKRKRKKLWVIVGIIFAFINFLYFANLIPPIPLSVKDVGAYHKVERTAKGYRVIDEKCKGWVRCFLTRKELHITEKREPIYVYGAVHAPSGMTLKIVHEWRKYDPGENKWVKKARIPYEVIGGNKEGFNLYTYNTVTPGQWQVNIETEGGQVIDRKIFSVIKSDTPPELIEKIK